MINIGINGLGRIGRAVTRIVTNSKDLRISVINDIDEDVKNLTYLLKYDSIYGKFNQKIQSTSKDKISINNKEVKFY